MLYNNPYGGWADAGQQGSSPWQEAGPPPSVFGALPYTHPSLPHSDLHVFQITSFAPNVLNSTVIGPQGQPCFKIITDKELPGYTVFKDVQSKNIALIEWKSPPMVEIRGVLSASANNWLKLTPDRSSRMMDIRGVRYIWAPNNQYIYLYGGSSATTLLARVSRGKASVVLELTPNALQLGLLNSIVVASFLLQCGRNID